MATHVLTIKDPDGINCFVGEVAKHRLSGETFSMDDDVECKSRISEAEDEVKAQIKRFVKRGKYIRIAFDLEAGTAVVLPA